MRPRLPGGLRATPDPLRAAIDSRVNRPIIGISCDHDDATTRYELSYGYVQSVVAAGGVPVLLPFGEGVDAAAQVAAVDGLLLAGGNDLDPTPWGEAWHPACKPADPKRQAHERSLIDAAGRRGTPTLGVCMGMQMMNVARGGSLFQHLPDVPGRGDHSRGGDWGNRHPVDVAEGSLLADVCGSGEFAVNTSHHQAVNKLGDGLAASAVAPDGLVEAVEDPSLRFWLGVQWHPERLTATEPRHLALFRRLVDAAGGV